jgi:chaperonin GroES
MKVQPLADNVLIERLEAETKTSGGIVLPDTAKESGAVQKLCRDGPEDR